MTAHAMIVEFNVEFPMSIYMQVLLLPKSSCDLRL